MIVRGYKKEIERGQEACWRDEMGGEKKSKRGRSSVKKIKEEVNRR